MKQKKDVKFIDLGLPSGTLWAEENATDELMDFDTANERYHLPKQWQWAELEQECELKWNSERKGYDVIGRNGNSIFLPAEGFCSGRNTCGVGTEGHYWSASATNIGARYICFFSSSFDTQRNYNRYLGFSVREVKNM